MGFLGGTVAVCRSLTYTFQRIGILNNRSASTLTPSTAKGTRARAMGKYITFDPDKFTSLRQRTYDLSGVNRFTIHFPNPDLSNEKSWSSIVVPYHGPRTSATTVAHINYPPGTLGVHYFHHSPGDSKSSYLRFRLCKDISQFSAGSDLRLPTGKAWGPSLHDMARSPKRYSGLLAALAQQFPIDPQQTDPQWIARRVISTLSPQKIVQTNHPVFNISNQQLPYIHCGDFTSKFPGSQLTYRTGALFPPNSTGVFYYSQSSTAPKQIGELRFRLCSNAQLFDKGVDLSLPSGDPWFLPSISLQTIPRYANIYNLLLHEGLMKPLLPPDLSPSSESRSTPHLVTATQPFAVDFSYTSAHVTFRINNNWKTILLHTLFHPGKEEPGYRGHAVVRFELYPQTHVLSRKQQPLVTMRILELLTPLRRASSNDYLKKPEPGQYIICKHGSGDYLPWGYTPRDPAVRSWFTQTLMEKA